MSLYDNGQLVPESPLITKGDIYTFDTQNQRLPIGANGQMLIVDLAEAIGLKWALPDNYNFGNDFQTAASLAKSSTTSSSFVPKLTLTTTDLIAGNYIVCANIAAKSNSSNRTSEIQIQIDNIDTLYTMQARNDQYMQVGLFGRVYTFTSGVHEIDVDYRAVDVATTAYIRDVEIVLWRVN